MPIPSTLTLNVGSPAADVVFTKAAPQGGEVQMIAPSAQGDLAGRPVIRVAHETTKSGLVRTLFKVSYPEWNATTGEYVGTVTGSATLVRKASAQTALTDKALESLAEALLNASVRPALVAAEL